MLRSESHLDDPTERVRVAYVATFSDVLGRVPFSCGVALEPCSLPEAHRLRAIMGPELVIVGSWDAILPAPIAPASAPPIPPAASPPAEVGAPPPHLAHGAKLTREQVHAILAAKAAGVSPSVLAREYGISRARVYQLAEEAK